MVDQKPLTLFVGTHRAAEQWARDAGWTRADIRSRLVLYTNARRLMGVAESVSLIVQADFYRFSSESQRSEAKEAVASVVLLNRLYDPKEE